MRPFDPHAHSRDLALPEEIKYTGDETHMLYRFYDAEKRLLYAGITMGDPQVRWAVHQRSSPWWTAVAYVWVEHFPDRRSAAAAEWAVIRSQNPSHNVAGRPGWHPSKGAQERKQRLRAVRAAWADLMQVPVTQARERFSDLIHRVASGGQRIVLTRHGKPVAALVSAEDLEWLQRIDLRTPHRREPWLRIAHCLYVPMKVSD